jgi:hypothetical protein
MVKSYRWGSGGGTVSNFLSIPDGSSPLRRVQKQGDGAVPLFLGSGDGKRDNAESYAPLQGSQSDLLAC